MSDKLVTTFHRQRMKTKDAKNFPEMLEVGELEINDSVHSECQSLDDNVPEEFICFFKHLLPRVHTRKKWKQQWKPGQARC